MAEPKAVSDLKKVLEGMAHAVSDVEKGLGKAAHGAMEPIKELKALVKRALASHAQLAGDLGSAGAGAIKATNTIVEAAALAGKMEKDAAKLRHLIKQAAG